MLNSIKNFFRRLRNWWHDKHSAETNALLVINEAPKATSSSYSKIVLNCSKNTSAAIFNITTTSGSASEIVKVLYEAIKGCEVSANCPNTALLVVNYPSVAVGITNLIIDLFPHQHEKAWKITRNIIANFGLTLHCILALQTDFARMFGIKGKVYESNGAFAGEIVAALAIAIFLNDTVRTFLTSSTEQKCRSQLANSLSKQLLEQSPIDNRGIFTKISDTLFGWLNGYFSGRGFILSMEQLFKASSANTVASIWTRHGIGLGYGLVTGLLGFLYQPPSTTDQESTYLQTALNSMTQCMQTIFFTTSLAKNLTELHHDAAQQKHFIAITTLWSMIALATIVLPLYKTYRQSRSTNQHDITTTTPDILESEVTINSNIKNLSFST